MIVAAPWPLSGILNTCRLNALAAAEIDAEAARVRTTKAKTESARQILSAVAADANRERRRRRSLVETLPTPAPHRATT